MHCSNSHRSQQNCCSLNEPLNSEKKFDLNLQMQSSNCTLVLTKLINFSECGFEADEEGTFVIDHLNFDVTDSGKHTLIIADPDNLIKSTPIVGNAKIAPVLYEVNKTLECFDLRYLSSTR